MSRKEEIREMAARERSVSEERAYIRAAEWADRTMIEKACKWLKENYVPPAFGDMTKVDDFINDFKKALTR